MYGYAFEVLCATYGTMLDNGGWVQTSPTYVAEVDKFLATAIGQENLVLDLYIGGVPVPFPQPTDFPALGYLSPDRIAKVAPGVRSLNIPAAPIKLQDALSTFMAWIEHAAKKPGTALAGFYY